MATYELRVHEGCGVDNFRLWIFGPGIIQGNSMTMKLL